MCLLWMYASCSSEIAWSAALSSAVLLAAVWRPGRYIPVYLESRIVCSRCVCFPSVLSRSASLRLRMPPCPVTVRLARISSIALLLCGCRAQMRGEGWVFWLGGCCGFLMDCGSGSVREVVILWVSVVAPSVLGFVWVMSVMFPCASWMPTAMLMFCLRMLICHFPCVSSTGKEMCIEPSGVVVFLCFKMMHWWCEFWFETVKVCASMLVCVIPAGDQGEPPWGRGRRLVKIVWSQYRRACGFGMFESFGLKGVSMSSATARFLCLPGGGCCEVGPYF